MNGIFITVEGPEGSGKTTAIESVSNRLLAEGYNVIITREPGGIEISEQIRNVILDKKNTSMDSRCEALLYAAARRQHLVEKVLPELKKGSIIICDRFIDSSLAYQGVGRNLGIDEIFKINEFAIDGLLPNKTIFFDLPIEVGLQRIHSNNRSTNRLDNEDIQFHKNVYLGYKIICEKFSDRIISIDANNSKKDVADIFYSIVKGLL